MSTNIIAFGTGEPAIENLNLCRRTVAALKAGGIRTVAQLASLSISDLLGVRNIGPTACAEIALSMLQYSPAVIASRRSSNLRELASAATSQPGDDLGAVLLRVSSLLPKGAEAAYSDFIDLALMAGRISRLNTPDTGTVA